MFKGHYDELVEVIPINHGFHVYTIIENPKSECQRVIYGIAYLDEDTPSSNIYNTHFCNIVYIGDTIVSNFDERNLYDQGIELSNGEIMSYYELIERNIIPKDTKFIRFYQNVLDTREIDTNMILQHTFKEAMKWYNDNNLDETVLL